MCASSQGGHIGPPLQEINYLFERNLVSGIMNPSNFFMIIEKMGKQYYIIPYSYIEFAFQRNKLDLGVGLRACQALTDLLHPNKNPVLAPRGGLYPSSLTPPDAS